MPTETITPIVPATRLEQKTSSAVPQAKPTPPELLKGDLSVPDDLGIESSVPDKVVAKVPVTETKSITETKLVEPKPVEHPLKPNVLGEQVKVKPSDSRDYAGFTDDQTRALKSMPNAAFDVAKVIFKERNELEQLKSATYLQSPDAYKLDPAYNSAIEDVNYATAESQIWQSELLKIKSGKDWTPFKGWDAQGKPVYDKPRQATDLDETDVLQRLLYTNNLTQQLQGKVQQVSQGYAQRIKVDTDRINSLQKEKFAWVADPETLKQTIDIPQLGKRTLAQVKSDFMGEIPVYHRSNIMADVSANMFVALQLYGQENLSLKEQLKIAEAKLSETTRAEPSSSSRATSPTTGKNKHGGPVVFTDDIGI